MTPEAFNIPSTSSVCVKIGLGEPDMKKLVPYLSFPQSSASSASQENRICQKINARKNIFAYYELPKTHRALVGDDDVRDSDVTLALQGFLHHKTKILLPHLTTLTVDMLLMVTELY